MRHLAYAGGWKKLEPLWDVAIRTGQVLHLLPVLEAILAGFGEQRAVSICHRQDGIPLAVELSMRSGAPSGQAATVGRVPASYAHGTEQPNLPIAH